VAAKRTQGRERNHPASVLLLERLPSKRQRWLLAQILRVVTDTLLDLLAWLPGLLLNPINDLVRIVPRHFHVLVSQLAELVYELLLQVRCVLTDLLLEHVVKTPLDPPCSLLAFCGRSTHRTRGITGATGDPLRDFENTFPIRSAG
jgi:hypothetical protein